MRFRLSFVPLETFGLGLPINYQYLVSAWLYKQVQAADPSFSQWLHQAGYGAGGKQFKLFTFSQLHSRGAQAGDNGRLQLGEPPTMEVGMHVPEIFRHMVLGLYLNHEGQWADRLGGLRFRVQHIEAEAPVAFRGSMQFKALSPVHLAYTNPRTGRKEHLHPDHREYEQWLFVNLCSKYHAVPGNAPQAFDRGAFALQALGPQDPRQHLVTLKEGRPDQTQLRAYSFSMQLTAPPALMEVAYHAGLGQKNSMGFGMLGIVNN